MNRTTIRQIKQNIETFETGQEEEYNKYLNSEVVYYDDLINLLTKKFSQVPSLKGHSGKIKKYLENFLK